MKPSIQKLALPFLTLLSINMAYAAATDGTIVNTSKINLQGGSNSSVQWNAPTALAYKIWVQIPTGSTATNATYHIYPKGNSATNTICSSTDSTYPCFTITVNQSTNQGKWVQLILNATTSWTFAKSGFVSVNASDVSSTKQVGAATVSFEDINPIAIGKTYKGGIIFYVDNTHAHGLIAAPKDQSIGIQWYNGSYVNAGATGTALGTGKANTTKIVSHQSVGNYAASICDALVIGSYSDWYLPSKDELNLIYKNIGQGATAPLTNIGSFSPSKYWSSSEIDNYTAWFQNFASGYQDYDETSYAFLVRAIRAF
jgi:Protein of unknown function (DUF1566)